MTGCPAREPRHAPEAASHATREVVRQDAIEEADRVGGPPVRRSVRDAGSIRRAEAGQHVLWIRNTVKACGTWGSQLQGEGGGVSMRRTLARRRRMGSAFFKSCAPAISLVFLPKARTLRRFTLHP